MGDFLSNLVARSFGLGEVVQPRPVSLFEPTPGPGMPIIEEPGSPENREEPTPEASVESFFLRHDLAGQQSPLPQPSVREENGRLEREDPPTPVSNQKKRRMATNDLPPPQPAPVPTHQSTPVTRPMSDHSPFEPIIQKGISEQESYSILEPVFLPPVAPAMEAFHREIVGSHPEIEIAPPVNGHEKRSHPKPEDSNAGSQPGSTMRAVQPQITTHEEPPHWQAEPVEPPKTAPTIHVTIGRLDVRATPPPSPPQKEKRSRALVMSLEEYLRQRAQGSGR